MGCDFLERTGKKSFANLGSSAHAAWAAEEQLNEHVNDPFGELFNS